MITYFSKHSLSDLGGFNLGGINGSGQVPSMPGNWGLVDLETPQNAYTKASYVDGSDWQLVFSDEFNTDGRTFYPGDDPYWEAVDLHYWAVRIYFIRKYRCTVLYQSVFNRQTTWSGTIRRPLQPRMVLCRLRCHRRKRTVLIIRAV